MKFVYQPLAKTPAIKLYDWSRKRVTEFLCLLYDVKDSCQHKNHIRVLYNLFASKVYRWALDYVDNWNDRVDEEDIKRHLQMKM